MIEGVDFSYDHPSLAGLAAAGKKFACRYLTGTTTAAPGSKNLTPSEAAALQAAGIDIVSNYETSVGFMLEGYDSGAKRAEAAWKQHKWCGGPDGRPIYFSLDMNATYDQWKQAKEFLKGAASAIGWPQVGMYGGLFQVDWAHDELGMHWLWQALGWSYGQVSPHIVLRQYKNGVALAGGTVDLDRAVTADFGQWAATGEDLSIVDDATKAYLEGKFNSLALLLMRGDATTDPAKDTHPNNLERTRQDIAAVLAAVKALALTLDPAQLETLATLVAAQLAIKGASYDLAGTLTPKPPA